MPQNYSGFTPDPQPDYSGFTPDPQPAPPKQEPGWLDTAASYIPSQVKSAWDWAVSAPEFIAKPVAEKAMEFSEWINPERAADYSPRSLISAYAESLGNVIPSLASPINLATAGAFTGAGTAAKYGLPAAARGLTNVGRTLSAPVAAEGAYHVATAEDIPSALLGGVEAVGGVLGAKAKVPTGKPLPVKQPAAPIDVTPESMPVRPPLVEGMSGSREVLPLNRPAPIEAPPPAQAFDPNTLVGLERATPPELQFVNPQTGEVRPASLAQPGDIPLIPETAPTPPRRAGRRMGQPELGPALPESRPPVSNQDMFRLSEELEARPRPTFEEQVLPHEFQPDVRLVNEPVPETGGMTTRVETPPETPQQPQGFADWLARLVKEESGEFNPNIEEWGLGRRVDEPPTRRVNPDLVPPWNRQEMDYLTDEQLSRYIRAYESRNTPESQAIVAYGLDLLDEHARNARTPIRAINRPELIEPETGRPLEPYEGPYPPVREIEYGRPSREPVKPGKTLEEVEAGKKIPALERLGKIIGEDRAQQLATGEREIRFSERPQRTKGKKLTQHDIRSWAEWGDSAIKEETIPDPSRPGLSFERHSLGDIFPNAFEIVYRDAQGNPIGVLKTDLSGKGIQTLAVDSKIGLRRGKVAFEMLKQAFDRGVNEPSGITSDLTKNLIDRVKRLISSESGELDLETLYKNINKIIESISKSKVGQTIGKFIRDESGEVDIDRLKALFRKQQEGTITPEELAEARAAAREMQTQRPAAETSAIGEINTAGRMGRFNALPESTQRAVNDMIAQGMSIDEALASVERSVQATATEVTQSLSDRLKRVADNPNTAQEELQGLIDEATEVLNKMPEGPEKQGIIRQIMGVNKAILTSYDLSAPGRQGKAFLFNKEWWTSLDDMVKAWGSETAAKNINQSIMDHPSGYFRRPVSETGKVGKSFADKVGLDLAATEEMFTGTILRAAAKIPGLTRSSRAHTAFLNKLRSDVFVSMMESAKKAGLNPETNIQLAKNYAKFINDATGRGSVNIGKWKLERNIGAINDVFFAPKNMFGQIRTWNNVLNPMKYYSYDPVLRKQALKSLFALAGAGLIVGEGARLAGAKVSNDPYSTDFRKIRVGDTRIDLFGGYQQFPVAAMKFIMGKETPTSGEQAGETIELKGGWRSRKSVAERFFTNRLSPAGSFIWAWMNNREFDGKPFEEKRALYERVFPIAIKDITELLQEDPALAIITSPLTITGLASTQHYTGR